MPRRAETLVTGEDHPTPFAWQKKTLPKNNILIGEDPAQLRFLVQRLTPTSKSIDGPEAEPVERVTDAMLLGRTGLLYCVKAAHRIDLSPDVRSHTGIWEAGPIERASAAVNEIVRHAVAIIDPGAKLSRSTLNFVANELTKEPLADIRGSLWHAVWLLTGEFTPYVAWPEPWNDPVKWLPPEASVPLRLQTLYRTLVGWAFLATGEEIGVKQLSLEYQEIQQLKQLRLDTRRVYESIQQLSIWRNRHSDPILCALAIASIWG